MTTDVTLRALREAKSLTQNQVAVAAGPGMDRELYNKLERGNRKLTATYAARLAPVLGVEVWDLVTSAEVRAAEPDEAPLSFGVRLRALEDRVAAQHKVRDEAMLNYLGRLNAVELAEDEQRDALQAIHARLDVLEEASGKQAPQGSVPPSAEEQG